MARKRTGKRGIPAGIKAAAGIGFALGVASYGSHGSAHPSPVLDSLGATPVTEGSPDAAAIAFARAQEGKPYAWGGTGPASYDCSGLAQAAWRAAGIRIERTSQEQWATGRHVASPQPGDLVYFPGSDGTRTAPGHVGLVVAAHQMIDAYATGTDIRQEPFGVPGSAPGTGPGQVVGYTDPDPSARPAPVPPVTAANYTPQVFAAWFLRAARLPVTGQNTCAVVWWQRREDTYLKFGNPLDSTLRMTGAWSVNSDGVKHYTSIAQGVQADAATIRLSFYPQLVSDFARSAPAQQTEADIDRSKWGTKGSPQPC